LTNIWSTLSKPAGLEKSKIEDYFDFAFAALPHKILQPEKFLVEVKKLGTRFRAGHRASERQKGLIDQEFEGGVFLPEYHRRIPADGFPHYAEGVWNQIVSNKDLDLPTQQELLAQFRCDEISRVVLESFDVEISPLEEKQAEGISLGKPAVLKDLGSSGRTARTKSIKAFELEAGRYHKGVYTKKRVELEGKIDTRLKALYQGQLIAAHKSGVASFSNAVSTAVKAGQKKGASYEFADIVEREKKAALKQFEVEAKSLAIEGVAWSNFKQQYNLYEKDLDEVSASLRKEEMRRLATRVERWVRSRLGDSVGLEFNKLGSGRGGSRQPKRICGIGYGICSLLLSKKPKRDLLKGQKVLTLTRMRSTLVFGASEGRVGEFLEPRLMKKSWKVISFSSFARTLRISSGTMKLEFQESGDQQMTSRESIPRRKSLH